MRARAHVAAALACLAIACGRGGEVEVVTASPKGHVTVASDAPRLVAANRELTALLGHPVKLDVDAALLPEHAPSFESDLADAVETVVHALSVVRRDDPRAFAYVAPALGTLTLRYDATIPRAEGAIDTAARALVVKVPRASFSFLTDGVVRHAIHEAHAKHLGATYAAADPKGRSDAELADIWETIVHYFRYRRRPETPPPAQAWDPARAITESDDRGLALLRALSFLPHARGELRAEVVKHLLDERHYLFLAFERAPEVARRAPADSVLKKVQVAYVSWVREELPRLETSQRVELARALFHGREGERAAEREALAGFDAYAFGRGALEAWLAAGAPTDEVGEHALFDQVLCPHREDERGEHVRNRGCSLGFHRLALGPEHRADLARALLAGPPAASASFAGELARDSERGVALLRALEGSAAHHAAVARVLARGARLGSREALVVEGFRLYRENPARRGAALYLLVSAKGTHAFPDVAAGLAPKLGARELGEMLDVAPDAMRFAPAAWAFAGPGAASAVVSRLDRFLDDRAVPIAERGEPDATVAALVGAACKSGRPEDVAALASYLARRASKHPEEAARWAGVRDQARPGACLTRNKAGVDR